MHVYWFAESEAGVPPGDEWLSERECDTLARLRVPKRRADWRLGRWTAKRAIAARLGLGSDEALARVEVVAAASGAPEAVIAGAPASVAISLSHSYGVGFCAVADGGAELGCDVEKVEARTPAFLRDYFTDEEQEMVRARPAQDRDRLVTLLWSAKESALKALRCGLRSDLRSVAASHIEVGADGEWLPIEVSGFGGWWRGWGGFVWTLVARPAPLSPRSLD